MDFYPQDQNPLEWHLQNFNLNSSKINDWIVWLPGLVTGLNVTCRAVGESGDEVMTATPVANSPSVRLKSLSGIIGMSLLRPIFSFVIKLF